VKLSVMWAGSHAFISACLLIYVGFRCFDWSDSCVVHGIANGGHGIDLAYVLSDGLLFLLVVTWSGVAIAGFSLCFQVGLVFRLSGVAIAELEQQFLSTLRSSNLVLNFAIVHHPPYSTSLANCTRKSCSPDLKLSPKRCDCTYPYEGTLYFRGPFFRELSNVNMFHFLEMSPWMKLGLTPGSVSLQNPFFNIDDYLQVQLELFPSTGKYFNRSEILRLGFALSNQTFKPPPEFGAYYFIASPYFFPGKLDLCMIHL
ncbi:hypothetical protein U1Q18_048907, partial [Sarracenia purpurea var. burkii]